MTRFYVRCKMRSGKWYTWCKTGLTDGGWETPGRDMIGSYPPVAIELEQAEAVEKFKYMAGESAPGWCFGIELVEVPE